MMDYWTLTGYTNDKISEAFLTSVEEEIARLKTIDLQNFGESKNPVITHEKVSNCYLKMCEVHKERIHDLFIVHRAMLYSCSLFS